MSSHTIPGSPTTTTLPLPARAGRTSHGGTASASFLSRRAVLVALALILTALPLVVSAPPAEAAFPGTNGKIAFVSVRDGNQSIYVMDGDGTNQVRLTTDEGFDTEPAWSPDGTRIAFESTRDGNTDIYVMNSDGTGEARLTTHADADTNPTWSPDGNQIAFESVRDGLPEIYVMDADGTGQTRLTRGGVYGGGLAWSPDGAHIAMQSRGEGGREIYVMRADGTDLVRLTDNHFTDETPAWQPIVPVTADDRYTSVPRTEEFVSPGGVLDNDEEGNWSVELVDGPTHGDLAMHPNGSFTYELADPSSEATTDAFTYQACPSPVLCSDPARVTLELDEARVATTLSASRPRFGFLFRSVTVRAQLSVDDTGDPLPGRRVVFGAGWRPICAAFTDRTGLATCSGGSDAALAVLLNGSYRANFAATDQHLESSTSWPRPTTRQPHLPTRRPT